jgi:hypothetical protein
MFRRPKSHGGCLLINATELDVLGRQFREHGGGPRMNHRNHHPCFGEIQGPARGFDGNAQAVLFSSPAQSKRGVPSFLGSPTVAAKAGLSSVSPSSPLLEEAWWTYRSPPGMGREARRLAPACCSTCPTGSRPGAAWTARRCACPANPSHLIRRSRRTP